MQVSIHRLARARWSWGHLVNRWCQYYECQPVHLAAELGLSLAELACLCWWQAPRPGREAKDLDAVANHYGVSAKDLGRVWKLSDT